MRTRTQLSLIIGSILALSVAHAQNEQRTPQNAQQNEATDRTGDRGQPGNSSRQSDSSSQPGRSDRQPQRPTGQDRDRSASGQSQAGQSQGGQSQGARRTAEANPQNKQQSGAAVLPVVTVLVPVAMQNKADTTLSNGCWAKLYGQNDLKGDSLTLIGPVDMPDMTGPFGVEWDDIDSIQAGPKATVVIYDNQNYRDRAATVKSGQTVNELSEKLGFFEDVNSIRINCSGGTG